jgi:hypothetical protein
VTATTLHRKGFKRKSSLYVADWEGGKTVKIGEFDVPLPKQPPRNQMENFGKRKRQQVFHRNKVPRDIKQWDKRDIDAYISAEWHKRWNGVWYLIGGRPIYLTGTAYLFFNYWHMENGFLPKFRMEAVEFFLFWEMCVRDRNCYGMYDIKARRLGDTEKALCCLWDQITKWRNSWGGMQHMSKDDAYSNFKRIVEADNKMVFFFKPQRKGSTDPERVLEFKYPEEAITHKKASADDTELLVLAEEDKIKRPLNSRIDFESTVLKKYDGKRLRVWYLDEAGKITEMNPVRQWSIIKPTMHIHNGKTIVGKVVITTTVEEFKAGGETIDTMKNSRKLWDGADPSSRVNGKTVNGMYRIFRNALLGAEVDRYGIHKKKEAYKALMEERDRLIEMGWDEDLADLCRKQPLTLDDVWMIPATECRLMPRLLDKRLKQIRDKVGPDGKPYFCPANNYTLVWKNGFGGSVEAIVDPDGRWEISQHPFRPNAVEIIDGKVTPKNRRKYTSGCDPVDHLSNKGKGSDMALTVHRSYDPSVDGHLPHDPETGDIDLDYVHEMKTDQFVCAYRARPDDPYEGYEDFLKTLIYYGCASLPENNKPGFSNWLVKLDQGKYARYIHGKPRLSLAAVKGVHTQSKTPGISATAGVINQYTDALIYHIKRRIMCTHLPSLILDWRQFKVTNRTERDLSVASGMNTLVAYDDITKIQEERKQSWVDPPWATYKRA